MRARDFLNLMMFAKRRLRSESDYREFQSFQANLVLDYIYKFGIKLDRQKVLDLGSGIGGYSRQMTKLGAIVFSVDLMAPSVPLGQGAFGVRANALKIPLQDNSVDFVFCASLIEHVPYPFGLLEEIQRVLKLNAACYLSFPPFFSPRGGHEFAPFHYLGERLALYFSRFFYHPPEWAKEVYSIEEAPRSFAKTYRDWGLFKLTIRKARKLIANTDLKVVDISARFFPVSFVRWPILGEVFTWHVQFLLRKAHGGN